MTHHKLHILFVRWYKDFLSGSGKGREGARGIVGSLK